MVKVQVKMQNIAGTYPSVKLYLDLSYPGKSTTTCNTGEPKLYSAHWTMWRKATLSEVDQVLKISHKKFSDVLHRVAINCGHE